MLGGLVVFRRFLHRMAMRIDRFSCTFSGSPMARGSERGDVLRKPSLESERSILNREHTHPNRVLLLTAFPAWQGHTGAHDGCFVVTDYLAVENCCCLLLGEKITPRFLFHDTRAAAKVCCSATTRRNYARAPRLRQHQKGTDQRCC